MKKMLSFLAIGIVAVVLPMSVHAASLDWSCDKSCPTENGKCEQTCKLGIKNNTSTITTSEGLGNITLTFTGDSFLSGCPPTK